MKKNLTLVLSKLIVFLLIATNAQAHDGHDHDAPVSVQAPKGGIIRKLEKHYIEVVSKAQDIKIYLYTEDLKPAELKGFKVFAKAQLPRKKNQESVSLKSENGLLQGSFDAKGSHRYTLLLNITEPGDSHQNTVKFNIEPKK